MRPERASFEARLLFAPKSPFWGSDPTVPGDDVCAAATDRLMLTLTLPQAATQAVFGGLSTTITYTFNATQRAATDK